MKGDMVHTEAGGGGYVVKALTGLGEAVSSPPP